MSRTRILHAQATGRFTEAERTIAMTDAIRNACEPDISDFTVELRDADRQAGKVFFKRYGV